MTLDSINCSFTNAFSIPVLGFMANPISLFIHTYCVHGMEFGTRDPKKWDSDPSPPQFLYFTSRQYRQVW